MGYGAIVLWTRWRFGRARARHPDPLLEQFVPRYDIVEEHSIHIAAPASVAFVAAQSSSLEQSSVVRLLIRVRGWVLGAKPSPSQAPRGMIQESLDRGWGLLAEESGRAILLGSVTQPWRANVVFRPLSPQDFIAFAEPEHVKIAWTMRVEPNGAGSSIFRTETRAVATDAEARARFLRYWSFISPGVVLIRLVILRMVKAEAERRRPRG